MSEQIREQVSAFLDGELPNSETELLLKRLTRDGELRESFGRYALIGEAIRGNSRGLVTKNFAGRVNLAIDGEPVVAAGGQARESRAPRWWRPFAGAAVAAGVAAVAVLALQQRAIAPTLRPVKEPVTAQNSVRGAGALGGLFRAPLLYGACHLAGGARGDAAGSVDQLCPGAQPVFLGIGSARRAGGLADRGR